jgi:hypothetical protein
MNFERWNGFSVTNASQSEGNLTYVKLNIQTPCPPSRACGTVPKDLGSHLIFVLLHKTWGHI